MSTPLAAYCNEIFSNRSTYCRRCSLPINIFLRDDSISYNSWVHRIITVWWKLYDDAMNCTVFVELIYCLKNLYNKKRGLPSVPIVYCLFKYPWMKTSWDTCLDCAGGSKTNVVVDLFTLV